MKKLAVLVTAAMLSFASAPSVKAQPASALPATQAELAQLLANLLGLSEYLPASPSSQELFSALLANNISPINGWDSKTHVTKADLARVIVQALGQTAEVGNVNNPQSWVNHLKSLNVSLDSIGSAIQNVEPLNQPVVGRPGNTWDPLENVTRIGEPDEKDFGADSSSPITPSEATITPPTPPAPVTVPQIVEVINQVPTPPARPIVNPPVTPN